MRVAYKKQNLCTSIFYISILVKTKLRVNFLPVLELEYT
jgi:hypothetical protein